MIDSIKKLGLFGLGMYAITQEKVDELVKNLVEEGEFNKEEGKKFVEDLIEKQKQQQKDFEEAVSEKYRTSLARLISLQKKRSMPSIRRSKILKPC